MLSLRKIAILVLLIWPVTLLAMPKVAVPDITYEKKLAGQYSKSANNQDPTRFDRGHLRKLTGDIKRALINSNKFLVVSNRPAPKAHSSQQHFDIIELIKRDHFPGADFVLFGKLSAFDALLQVNDIAGSSAKSSVYEIHAVVDFDLISTRTLQIASSFTAYGEGSDIKLINKDNRVKPSPARATKELSANLAREVIGNLVDQLDHLYRTQKYFARKEKPAKKKASAETAKISKKQPLPLYNRKLVAEIQHQLNLLGYNAGKVDGVYGRGTKQAIENYQFDQRINVNGVPSMPLLVQMETQQEAVASQENDSTPAAAPQQVVEKEIADKLNLVENESIPENAPEQVADQKEAPAINSNSSTQTPEIVSTSAKTDQTVLKKETVEQAPLEAAQPVSRPPITPEPEAIELDEATKSPYPVHIEVEAKSEAEKPVEMAFQPKGTD
jgi:peptidoglycan hydrolase-like protein with peptidoglycan-binding domain